MSDSLKILFTLTPPFRPNEGGVQMSTKKLASCFLGRGHDVTVLSMSNEENDQLPGVVVHGCLHPGGASSPANLSTARDVISAFGPDIVINQMPYEHGITSVLAGFPEVRKIACLRNTLFSVKNNLEDYARRIVPDWLPGLPKSRIVQSALLIAHRFRHRSDLKKILRSYDRFVMFAEPNLMELGYFVPNFDRRKIALIPNSIPSVFEKPDLKENVILWLGRLDKRQKQCDLIVPIWKRLCNALPDWRLEIVGSGPDMAEVTDEAATHGLERIRFFGKQKPDAFYASASVFLMTSSFEGFPNTVVEAQSFGAIPVLFNSFPVAEYLVKDGVNGILCAPYDLDEMADRIIDLCTSPEREKMADAALRSAERFTIERVGERWDQLFKEVLGDAAG